MNSPVGIPLRLCLLLAAVFGHNAGSLGAPQPNIVIILSDDAGYNSYGFTAAMNHRPTTAETPNLDALAQQSVILRQGYVTGPLCGTSRAGLLTGQYQQRYGVEENLGVFVPSNPTWGLTSDQKTIAERLKPLGYTTGLIGKWHSGYLEGLNRPNDKGFDEFYGIVGGHRTYFTETNFSLDRGIWKNNQYYETQYRTEGDPTKYEPGKGRYVTDAWGEEAVNFINNHAHDANPFFLYLSYTAPHTPNDQYCAKQADWDRFADVSDPNARALAAMQYGMDRSIGEVIDSLEANHIDDNTIIVFMNDNGAPALNGDNSPWRGRKGSVWEAGIRVPFFIKAPGLTPGIYDGPVTGFDILPTLVKAGGGDISQIPTDGYDVMPALAGTDTDTSHEMMFWRSFDAWAVRMGDWKLTTRHTASGGPNVPYLHNLATDPGELTAVNPAHRDVEAELFAALAHWEAAMAKPRWGLLSTDNQNQFDHFLFRNDLAAATNWSAASAWKNAGKMVNATMTRGDAYANGVVEFTVRNDADYSATNDMVRMSQQTFMLNQLQMTGNFTGAASHQGTINGNNLLFVRSLSGQLPRIRLDATASGTPATFAFQFQSEVQLLDDLEITGDGTQDFVIAGRIRDFYVPTAPASVVNLITTPHNVRKLGTSKVTLTGNNTFGGTLTIDGGELAVNGAAAAIDGAASIIIQSGGRLALHDGMIKTPALVAASGSEFQFDGGTLKTTNMTGSLANTGGTFEPGMSTAICSISQNFSQSSGTLQIELGGTNAGTGFDKLQVGGSASLAGKLEVQLVNGFNPSLGQSFQFLTSGGVSGKFHQIVLPALSDGLSWQVIYRNNGVTLTVGSSGQPPVVSPIGDDNRDGMVDAAKYRERRNSRGSTKSTTPSRRVDWRAPTRRTIESSGKAA